MRILVLTSLCILAGCGTHMTMEQLEAEALVTGDWSAVRQRESAIKRRQQRYGPACPARSVRYCVETMLEMRCSCVAKEAIYSAFGRF